MGIKLPGVRVAMVVFGLNSGAYISEIMRSGIQSVDPGQLEAGRAVGLGFGPAMIRIVIPQAVKNILPTLGNEFIALIKETSVVSFVGAADLYVAFMEKYMFPCGLRKCRKKLLKAVFHFCKIESRDQIEYTFFLNTEK